MKWYYALNNQRQGPVSENEFDFLVSQKRILPETLVWNETMKDWRPLREVQPEPEPPQPVDWSALRQAPPPPPERDGPAWEARDLIGGLNAAMQTVMELLGNSDRGFSRMRRVSDWAGPYCFALFLWGIAFYANFGYLVLTCRMDAANLRWPWVLLTSNYVAGFSAIMFYFMIPAFVGLTILFNSVLIHLCLAIVGGATQPFQTTYRVVCYSLGASAALQLIPELGPFLATVFNLILMINGIARMHDVSKGRAILAVSPMILFVGLLMLVWLGVA